MVIISLHFYQKKRKQKKLFFKKTRVLTTICWFRCPCQLFVSGLVFEINTKVLTGRPGRSGTRWRLGQFFRILVLKNNTLQVPFQNISYYGSGSDITYRVRNDFVLQSKTHNVTIYHLGSIFYRISLGYTEIKFISEYKVFKKLKLSTKALKTTLESETEYKGIKA